MTDIEPLTPPPLAVPGSSSICTIRAIDTTLQLYVKSLNFLHPVIPGHETYNCPAMAFLINHESSGRKVLFDAGGRKDYWNYSPVLRERFRKGVHVKGLRCEKGIDEVLLDASVELEEIESSIWSHWHFDHVGDMSKFPPSTKTIVGPGFKANLLPGYPSNPDSTLLESDYNTHELIEIPFTSSLKIGNFKAHDFFGDGSFYLLDVPGHAIGHMKFKTISLYPLTQETHDPSSSGLDDYFPSPCPGETFLDCHPAGNYVEKRTSAYYTASRAPGSAYLDADVADESIAGMKEFDASEDVFVCLAHDPALFEVLPLLNGNEDGGVGIGDWKERGYKEMTRWRFLNELPRMGMPGREPIVSGFWREGKVVSVEEALLR